MKKCLFFVLAMIVSSCIGVDENDEDEFIAKTFEEKHAGKYYEPFLNKR